MLSALLYIGIISASIYLMNMLQFIIGINKPYPLYSNNKQIPISIIVAIKDGGASVPIMLDNLANQKYAGIMEFILVDDNSKDNTKQYILEYTKKDSRFKYIKSSKGSPILHHKKRALDAGINAASYEHLLFTDIDCIIQLKWARSMAQAFNEDSNYIIGHSYVNDNTTLLSKFQKIDFQMLLFASYGSTSMGEPWACTGQNQAYTKTLYKSVGGFESLHKYLQGDDTLFLQLAIKKGANIVFNKNPSSYVISRTEKKWKHFLLQRARWAGDANEMWKFNLSFYIAALATFNMNFMIIALITTTCLKFGLSLLLFKFISELMMYISGMNKIQNEKANYFDFILWSVMVPLYTVLMGLASFFHIQWKGKSV